MTKDLMKLAADIEALSPPDQLRVAAELLDAGKTWLAYSIADRVVLQLGAALCLARKHATEGRR